MISKQAGEAKSQQGDFDTLWNMLPIWVLAAELYNDEETRKGLEFLDLNRRQCR